MIGREVVGSGGGRGGIPPGLGWLRGKTRLGRLEMERNEEQRVRAVVVAVVGMNVRMLMEELRSPLL